ncbi:MAG: flavin reductase [Armatimonadetes bacterium]|nr:flavin reductase [Armatimonadota bacterium]
MEEVFKKTSVETITLNPFEIVLKDWMLVTAGPPEDYNTMTAGWGGMGALWGKPICFCVIRPTRHTYKFLEKNENFTLCFFSEEYKEALQFCGSKSGRDVPDKARQAGLTPMPGMLPMTSVFKEARLVFECRKIYIQDIDPKNFLDPNIEQWYPQKDYHRLYVGEVINCWTK